jgi:predicted membrane protein
MDISTQFFVERFAAIFIFTLIISGNFLAQLFPCKIQEALMHNIFIKHIFGFFTLFFFGILAIPELANIPGMISSLILYIIFLINAKTKYQFWIAVFLLYGFIYMLHIIKKEYDSYLSSETTKPQYIGIYKERNKYIEITQNISMGLIVILTTLGFLIYMGEKKIEYGNNFNYHTFLLGKPSCRSSSPKDVSFINALKVAFTK